MDSKAETLAILRRVLLRHSQGMTLGGSSILGLPTITHEVVVIFSRRWLIITPWRREGNWLLLLLIITLGEDKTTGCYC